jgi:hypothetical protein
MAEPAQAAASPPSVTMIAPGSTAASAARAARYGCNRPFTCSGASANSASTRRWAPAACAAQSARSGQGASLVAASRELSVCAQSPARGDVDRCEPADLGGVGVGVNDSGVGRDDRPRPAAGEHAERSAQQQHHVGAGHAGQQDRYAVGIGVGQAGVGMVKPGPLVTAATPRPPVTRAYPSAALTAAASCRKSSRSIPESRQPWKKESR